MVHPLDYLLENDIRVVLVTKIEYSYKILSFLLV